MGVTPLTANTIISEAKGAYVNVACVSSTKANLKMKLRETFKCYKCEVFEILDIETEHNLIINNKENSEKIKLLNEIKEGYQFAWGTFYTFD